MHTSPIHTTRIPSELDFILKWLRQFKEDKIIQLFWIIQKERINVKVYSVSNDKEEIDIYYFLKLKDFNMEKKTNTKKK